INLINGLEKKKKELENKLHVLKHDQRRKRKKRSDFKAVIHQIVDKHPDVADTLKRFKRIDRFRPKLEVDQPALLQTIIDITLSSAAADDRRQTESLRSIKTLDNLSEELENRGFSISRSATYLRLLPRRSNTSEDSHFAAATVEYLKDLAILFGSKSVFVISQDDKARVPLGLPAAKQQAPILMHLEYRMELPDHDFVVAEKHKLIPSVYGALIFKNKQLSYSGPTYIGIRSGKHEHSTAFTHLADLSKCLSLIEFKCYSHTDDNKLKPILIVFTDGGPDENPRFPKARQCYADLFIRNNLDVLLVAINAPDHSVYNPIELRMAPLSHDLSGLILPHDYYGNHLDDNGKTNHIALEEQNFQRAGDVLAEVWSNTVIDTH
ncbi:unnamed protein product, partial [Rotaria sp. Silwood1]